jgi:hypothetical protein
VNDLVPAVRSDLALLVDAEAQLDRALAAARDRAQVERAAARQRADLATTTLAVEIERERERVATEIARATEAQLSTIDAKARAECARFDAVVAEVVTKLAHALAARLAALAFEESAP